MIKKTLLGSTLAALVLVGCGGGGDTTADLASSNTGYLVDSAVSNAKYDCLADGDYNKTTGSDGSFTCKNMKQIRFRIGNMLLGEIANLPEDRYVFPQDLAGVARNNLSDSRVIAMAQLLQSLDEDADLANGIQIPSGVQDMLEDQAFDPSSLNVYLETLSILPAHIRKETEAREHLQETMQNLLSSTHNSNSNSGHGNGGQQGSAFDITAYPLSTLTPELKDAIAYMGNEERLAYDIYTNLYTYHFNNGIEINQLQNIANNSEVKHIAIVQSIVQKYDLNASDLSNVSNPVSDSSVSLENMPSGQYDIQTIQDLYNTLHDKGIVSKQDALEVGCMVEVTDVDDLDHYIALAEASGATDIVDAFNILRDGSYNHYWAFDKGLKNMGISEGCCSLGAEYCHSEYPQNSHGNQ